MSWPFVALAWPIPLAPMVKLVALALADQADPKGAVVVSLTQLRRMTGQSEQTVRRSLRELQLAQLVTGGTGSGASFGRYQLHYRAATVVGVPESQGCQAGQGGLPDRFLTLDPLIDPVKQKSRAAPRLEIPTRDQVTKLVHVLIEDPAVEISDGADLRELLKRACAHAGFHYDADVVTDGINRALAQRGLNPNLPLDVRRVRRR